MTTLRSWVPRRPSQPNAPGAIARRSFFAAIPTLGQGSDQAFGLGLVDDAADLVEVGDVDGVGRGVLDGAAVDEPLDELLLAAEYIMAEGNYNVILCERGVRTFADHTRNTLDLSIVPAVQNPH